MRINSIQSFNIKKTNNQNNRVIPKKQATFSGYIFIKEGHIIDRFFNGPDTESFYNHTVHLAEKFYTEQLGTYLLKCKENAPKEWSGKLSDQKIEDLKKLKEIFSNKNKWSARYDMSDDTNMIQYSSYKDAPNDDSSFFSHEDDYDPDDHGTPKDY